MRVKCLTVRIATLLVLTSFLGACSTNYNRPQSVQMSANTEYAVNNSSLALGLNLLKLNHYNLSASGKQKHENAIYIALQTLDNGERINWAQRYYDEEGHIRVLSTYSYGDGYCRDLDVLIRAKGKTRSLIEKGCWSSTAQRWTFLR
jgi:surface antigen